MIVIHIQEVNSDQVVEVMADSIKQAIRAYAKHTAFNWSDLHNYFIRYYEDKIGMPVRVAVFYFKTEKLTIRNIYGNRYLAVWSDL